MTLIIKLFLTKYQIKVNSDNELFMITSISSQNTIFVILTISILIVIEKEHKKLLIFFDFNLKDLIIFINHISR